MLFDIPFIADWKIIGELKQRQTDLNTARKNEGRIDYDYKIGQKNTCTERRYTPQSTVHTAKRPMDNYAVHTNGTIMVQC